MEVTDQIGIDIGMTHSRVSIFKDGRPQVLSNELASNLTPSYVAYTENLCHVGDRAQEQEPMNVSSTVHGVRRLLGYGFTDLSVQQYYGKIPYKFFNIRGRPRIEVKYQKKSKCVAPEEIWALLLERMVEIGANALGEKIKKAVITVPSQFTCYQRRAVKDAAAIVGIDSELINETTAAALAYVYEMKSELMSQKRNLLVYNMGGGFTTATVVSVKNQHVSVLCTAGDMHLGGEDFDNVLADYCCRRFMEKHNIDVSQCHRAMCLIRRASKKAKRELSFSVQTTIEVEDICPGMDFEDAITRKVFEDQCEKLFERAQIPAVKAFEGADLSTLQIDDIILVGGSTRMPRIQQQLRSLFNMRSVNLSMDPFETAVLGAAVHMARSVTVQDVIPVASEEFQLKETDVLKIKEALKTYRSHRAEDTDRILANDAKEMLLGCVAKLSAKLKSEELSEYEKIGYSDLRDNLRVWLNSNANYKSADFESILKTFNKGVMKIKRETELEKQNLQVLSNSSHTSGIQDIRVSTFPYTQSYDLLKTADKAVSEAKQRYGSLSPEYSSPNVGMTSFAIGIDLGTTYSCVGVVKDGQVKIIHNGHGFSTTASCVAFTKYERLVGDAAKEQGIKNFHNTVFDVKRLMGRKFNEETVQNDMKYWPFKVVNVDGRCRIQVEEKGMTKIYTPEELSAMVLTNMKETAEAYLRQKVKEAVITVPAYFNDSQRQATKDAAKIAGLKVLRIINEPTAAGIAYALDEKAKKQQNILIYDLGGGTFDVTVMVIQNGNFNVKSTSGDTHLGGEDFNTCLVEYCAAEFKKKNGIDLSNNFKALRRLRKACEKAKRLLSHQTYATIEVDGLADYMDFSLDITRGRFEEICFHLFKKTLESVTKALEDAKMDKSKIDEIILVGGSTRIPRIKRIVIDYFKGKKLNNTVHPDEAVAYGAAVQAAILNGNKSALVRNVVIKDVTPLTLGLSTYSGAFSRVIERNSPLPAKGTVVHYTVWDNQKDCLFRIYQGENERYKENIYLGEFTLTGLREAPKGEVEFDAFFEVDENGILDVKITERGTNNFGTITITKNAGYLSKEEIAQMIKNEEKNVEDSRLQKLLAEARNAMETI